MKNRLLSEKQIKFIASTLIVGVCIFVSTSTVKAQTGLLPFAGIVSFPEECTCTGNTWIWFVPLYLGGPVNITGPMIYSPYFTTLYAYFGVDVPTTWDLGDYIEDPGACEIYYGYGCFELPAIGLMNKVGTSYPGFQAP